jgi:hypothetical protein
VTVQTTKHRSPGMAECERCEIDTDSTRRQAREHAADTGHTVHFIVEDRTTYRPEPPPTSSPAPANLDSVQLPGPAAIAAIGNPGQRAGAYGDAIAQVERILAELNAGLVDTAVQLRARKVKWATIARLSKTPIQTLYSWVRRAESASAPADDTVRAA